MRRANKGESLRDYWRWYIHRWCCHVAGSAIDSRGAADAPLKFIPQSDLTILDPIVTTVYTARNHGYMVFDTLFGMDSDYQMQPQMLEGFSVENDGKRWKLKFREGLLWHDGEKVLARDCVASIRAGRCATASAR